MSLPIYQRVAVTDAGDVIPGAEYTVINENTGVAAPIYSDRTGATLLTAPYFADSVGTIQFFIAQGTTFRVAASGGVGTYTDRYVYGVAEAVLVDASGNADVAGTVTADGLVVSGATADFLTTLANSTSSGNGLFVSAGDNSGDRILQLSDKNGAEKLRVTALGNVGIGTSSPVLKLSVDGDIWQGNQGGAEIGRLQNEAGWYDFKGSTNVLGVQMSHGSTVRFNTNSQERMRIASDGNLFVGCASIPTGGASTGLSISNNSGKQMVTHGVEGTANTYVNVYKNANGIVGGIRVIGSATAYDTSSDYRLKEDDVPMTGATERVKLLRPINFAWKVDGSRTDGFFAHEVQEVVPESAGGSKDAMRDEEYEVTPAVYEDVTTPAVEAVLGEDGMVITEAVEESTESVLVTEAVMATRSVPDYQGIDQSKLVPLLTATIQELIARIEALESGA